jgi:PAS domain S-box-containing protein
MRKLKLLIVLILFNLQVFMVVGQTHKIDSLENLLLTHTQEDTFRVNLLNETAWLIYSKDNEKCLKYAEEAEKLANALDYNVGKATSSNVLGIHYYVKGNYPQALEYFHKAINMNEKIGNKIGTASCLNNIGAIHLMLDNNEEALESFQKSLKIKQEIGDKRGIPSSYNNIGTIYLDLKNYTKAQESFQKSLELKKELGDNNGIAVCYNNLGLLFQEQGRFQEALEYLQKSLKITIELKDNYDVCLDYLSIGNVYFDMKNNDKALDYTLKSLAIAIEHEFLDLQKDIRLQLAKIYESTNNFEKAYENHVIYKELNDSLFNEENIKKITGLEYQYKYEKEKQAIELEQLKKDVINAEERKRQKIVHNSFIAGFILMLLLVVVVLRSFLQKRKSNQILASQKQIIEEFNEEILAQSEELSSVNQELEKLSIVASETDNAILIMDSEGNHEWANESFKRIYGCSLEEYILKNGKNMLESSTNTDIKKIFHDCVESKKSVIYESKAIHVSGTELWLQTTLTPIVDSVGNINQIIAIDSDISKLKEAEKEILLHRDELFIKNDQIKGSITYAQTIQNAILPAKTEIDKYFESFILFRPKDIVSGDFYWYTKVENYHFFAVVDCTGHGVPGAFMSMIGSRLLSEVIVEQKCFSPSEILKKLDNKIHKVLKQEKTDIQDGMDVCLCRIEIGEKVKVLFSGAKRDLLHYNLGDKSLEVITGERKSIGGKTGLKNNEEFNETELEISKGDILYLTTDGFIDQNNKERKRFGSNEFNELLKNNAEKPLNEQKILFENALDSWMLNTKQRDDIAIVGIKV